MVASRNGMKVMITFSVPLEQATALQDMADGRGVNVQTLLRSMIDEKIVQRPREASRVVQPRKG